MQSLCRSISKFFTSVGFTPAGRFTKTRFHALGRNAIVLAAAILLSALGLTPGFLQAQVQTYTCPTAFGPVAVVPVPLAVLLQSLRTVANPVLPNGPTGAVRDDLTDYIADQSAAIQLGKALFWDMQAGSDNKTACATCHFKAGADGRDKNQLNPGANNDWDAFAGLAPNYSFNAGGNDFPFTVPLNRDTDNIVGSQGVRLSTFQGLSKKGAELTASVADPVFNAGGVNVRQVTGKNTPSTINAVFNHRNFWNGRAQPDFNGVNPFGSRDGSARVWMQGANGAPAQIDIHIQNASLASQAVGPPLNPVEMSAAGRTFPDLGHKLLIAKPLRHQAVSATDSVLGTLADPTTGKGLKVTYGSLIAKAFQPKWWKSARHVTLNGKHYTMKEANFSLFWGLSVMLYEATLVADNSAMDQYLLTRVFSTTEVDPINLMPLLVSHDPTLLDPAVSRLAAEGISVTRDDILNGLALFERPVAPPPSFPVPDGFGVGCIGCHVGAETTSASVRNLTGPGVEIGDVAFKGAGFDLRMERMFMKADWTPPGPLTPVPLGTDAITFDPSTYAVNVIDEIIPFPGGFSTPISPAIPLPVATYDAGWYNLGVRPTADDPGLGGSDPFGLPLSWTQLFQGIVPGLIKVPGNGLGCAGAGDATFPNTLLNASGFPLLSGPLLQDDPSDVPGTFKVPGLRNVELNGPYFHNGGKSTLAQVVDFYDTGGDFANATKPPALVPLQLKGDQRNGLLAFLLALTDERVYWQKAPFDHPQLQVPNGDNPPGTDNLLDIPAVGASGSLTPLQSFLNLNPFSE
jgi:cytochrome c peroxidase